jgi:hypothetical protein
MHDIPIEKISTFFGNTLEDGEKHLFRFKITCDVFNLIEYNVTCRLFLQTVCGYALEWYHSLLPGTITNWDMLETLFAKTFIPYVPIDDFNVASHPPFPTWTQYKNILASYILHMNIFRETSLKMKMRVLHQMHTKITTNLLMWKMLK